MIKRACYNNQSFPVLSFFFLVFSFASIAHVQSSNSEVKLEHAPLFSDTNLVVQANEPKDEVISENNGVDSTSDVLLTSDVESAEAQLESENKSTIASIAESLNLTAMIQLPWGEMRVSTLILTITVLILLILTALFMRRKRLSVDELDALDGEENDFRSFK